MEALGADAWQLMRQRGYATLSPDFAHEVDYTIPRLGMAIAPRFDRGC